MKRILSLRLLLATAALAALGACASSSDATLADISGLSPLELVGRTVESADGTRVVGNVKDLVLGPGNRIEQVIVATGAPAYPSERRVAVDTGALRLAPSRNALKLVGMSTEQFAALPSTMGEDNMIALGGDRIGWSGAASGPGLAPGAIGATNWTGATIPR